MRVEDENTWQNTFSCDSENEGTKLNILTLNYDMLSHVTLWESNYLLSLTEPSWGPLTVSAVTFHQVMDMSNSLDFS